MIAPIRVVFRVSVTCWLWNQKQINANEKITTEEIQMQIKLRGKQSFRSLSLSQDYNWIVGSLKHTTFLIPDFFELHFINYLWTQLK